MSKQQYHVTWEIEIDAHSPRDAAIQARRVQQDPGSTAVVFDIVGEDDMTHTVDLADVD